MLLLIIGFDLRWLWYYKTVPGNLVVTVSGPASFPEALGTNQDTNSELAVRNLLELAVLSFVTARHQMALGLGPCDAHWAVHVPWMTMVGHGGFTWPVCETQVPAGALDHPV